MRSTLLSVRQRLHQQPFWIAVIIVVVIVLWIVSGMSPASSEASSSALPAHSDNIAKVQVERMYAEQVSRNITLYGRTEPDRTTTLRAEQQGAVASILVEEGQRVKKGQVLLRLDSNNLNQRLRAAKALLAQREIELEAATSLDQQGFQSKANLALAESNLELAKSDVQTIQLALQKIDITAPYDGVMNERFVEVGTLVREGDDVATIVDLDPLVIVADVNENHVHQLTLSQIATARVVSGHQLEGTIRYISSISNQGTNTFKVEVSVPNSDYQFMAGMSAELAIPLVQTWAIKVSPAVMALDEEGNLGVKTVVSEQVKFVPIDMVKSDKNGVWLAGLGRQADVITLGHSYVRDGDAVLPTYVGGNKEQDR